MGRGQLTEGRRHDGSATRAKRGERGAHGPWGADSGVLQGVLQTLECH